MLFNDLEKPRRFRVHGAASVAAADPLIGDYNEACLMVRITIENAFTNCARYIHNYTREPPSRYMPRDGTETPPPDRKRVDEFQDALPERDRGIAEKTGGVIMEEEYRKDYWCGLG
jgi:hypothetical protein